MEGVRADGSVGLPNLPASPPASPGPGPAAMGSARGQVPSPWLSCKSKTEPAPGRLTHRPPATPLMGEHPKQVTGFGVSRRHRPSVTSG